MLDYVSLQPEAYKYVPASNYTNGRGSQKIRYTVLHHNGATLSHGGVYNAFVHNGTSAHYNVDIDGKTCQYVDDWNTAYHAGDWLANQRSIGIEHCDNDTADWTIADATLEEGAHLVAAVHHAYGLGKPKWLVNVFPHSYFADTLCPGAIGGSQRDAYMTRAQYWYDAMAGRADLPPALQGYTDLISGEWYIDGITFCVDHGYMMGSGGKFRPLDHMTRAEAVCIVLRVAGKAPKALFADVAIANPYYYDALVTAKDLGIIHGNASGNFRPNDAILRCDFLVMLYNAFGGGVHETIAAFEDTPVYAKDAVAWAYNRGIITKIAATQPCTRAEAAAIVTNYCNQK